MSKVFILLSCLAVALASGHPWACFHGDPQHTGLSSNVVGAPLSPVAAYGAGDQISGSPVVRQDGSVLVGARDVKLYCLEPNLADTLWVADLAPFGSNIYYSTPALDDSGDAYITTDRRLVKVSSSGAVLWSWPSNNSLSISHSPVIGLGQDRKVYLACYSESLYALNPGGALIWTRPLGRSANSAPAVGLNGHILVATTRDSAPWQLWSFKPNGDTDWSCTLAGDAEFASPAVGPDSTIYVGANRYLYAVRPNGTLKWRDSLLARIQSCPAVANESTVYVVAGARLYCIGADSVVRWRRTIGGSNYCSPAIDAAGNIYVGTANGASSIFYCIGPDSTVRDSHVIGDDIWSSPAIGESGRVYVGCMDSSLYLFQGPGSGVAELDWRHRSVGTRLLPNPTCGVARIMPFGRYSARVFDACGALVAAASDADRVDLRGLRRGVYLVQVAGAGLPPQKLVLR
jgi:outer membrane protein assembly factor BamB